MIRGERRDYLFILPSLVALVFVTIYPLAYLLYLSLHRKLLIFDISRFVSLENFFFLLKDPRFVTSLGNTIYFTVTSVALELVLGLGIALFIKAGGPRRGLIRAIILVPWAVPTVVSAKMWEWIYNADFGILNYLLGAKVNWLGDPFWAMNAAVFMDVWKTTPFVALLLTAGLQVIPVELYQAARIDGAGSWYIFRRITLPLLKPMLIVVLLFRTIDAFRVFDAVYVLTGGGPANTTETLSIYAYKILFQTLQFGYGSAVSLFVFLCVGFISIVYVSILRRGAYERLR